MILSLTYSLPVTMTSRTLRRVRDTMGLTQKAFAKLIGIHPNSLARMERGELGLRPTTERLIRLLVKTHRRPR